MSSKSFCTTLSITCTTSCKYQTICVTLEFVLSILFRLSMNSITNIIFSLTIFLNAIGSRTWTYLSIRHLLVIMVVSIGPLVFVHRQVMWNDKWINWKSVKFNFDQVRTHHYYRSMMFQVQFQWVSLDVKARANYPKLQYKKAMVLFHYYQSFMFHKM